MAVCPHKNPQMLVLRRILKTELKVVNNYSQALPPQPCIPDLTQLQQVEVSPIPALAAAVQIFKANKD